MRYLPLVLLAVIVALLCWLVIDLGHRSDLVTEAEPALTATKAPQAVHAAALPPSTQPPTTTTARARTAPTVRSASVSRQSPAYVGSIPDLIRRVFARFGPDVAEQAVRVSFCESRHNPAATNGQHASLFQVSRTYHEDRARRLGFTWDRMWDPEVNSLVAADIYASSGWQPWTCRHAA